jgi:class 3 adenylate cyclase
MVCSGCGTTNEAGRRFCVECGARLAAGCPSCGAANPVGAKFCGDCGTGLTDAAPDQTQLASPPASPERAGTAERRIVSVLFADLVGFTAASERRDHEDTRDLQDLYFQTARRIVERYGGIVEKYIGDAVMAVWGAPTAHEDDAERAVRAGLELVEAVGDLSTGDDPPLQARAAVMTGEAAVSVGATGQGLVTGDLVNTAARLQSVADPGGVLVGEATQRAAGAAIAFKAEGVHRLKGKEAPVAAWRALRVVAAPAGRRDTTLEAPFVGRARATPPEGALRATAADRRIQLVSIVGHAGIGKSRLAWELEKSVTGLAEPAIWLQGLSPAYGDGVTLWALGEMFRQAAGIAESDDIVTTDRRLAEAQGRLELSDDERGWVALLLGHDAGTGAARDELMAGWRQAFERMSRIAPLVLVFEDLQWADDGLVDFIEELHDRSRDSRILIVTLSRPELRERRPDWGAGRRNFVSIDLEPLSDEAMIALMDGLAPGLHGRRSARRRTRHWCALVRRRDGPDARQPGPVVARMAGSLSVGVWTGSRCPDAPWPHRGPHRRLRPGSHAGRRRRLRPRARGQIDALSALAGEPAEDLTGRLRSLVDHEILRLESDPASPERGQYRFLQAPVREVAYATLAKRDRRAKHLAAAAFYAAQPSDETAVVRATHELEALRATPSGPEADTLAVQARASLGLAAERAATLWSNAQAADLYESAIAITTDPAELAWSRLRSGELAVLAARYDQADVRLREAIEGPVQLDGVEMRGVVGEPGTRRQSHRVEAALPARVDVSRGRSQQRHAPQLGGVDLIEGVVVGVDVYVWPVAKVQ